MYYVSKRMEIAGAHELNLPYPSKCCHLHGHNWIITVHCLADKLTDYGMVLDFTIIKELIHKPLDHTVLNTIIDVNPTAENIAKWICDTINNYLEENAGKDLRVNPYAVCYKVEVQESEGNVSCYEVAYGAEGEIYR